MTTPSCKWPLLTSFARFASLQSPLLSKHFRSPGSIAVSPARCSGRRSALSFSLHSSLIFQLCGNRLKYVQHTSHVSNNCQNSSCTSMLSSGTSPQSEISSSFQTWMSSKCPCNAIVVDIAFFSRRTFLTGLTKRHRCSTATLLICATLCGEVALSKGEMT